MAWTLNPYQLGETAGTEVSPRDHGRTVALLESLLTHQTHTDGFVDKGDALVCSDIIGVALLSADAATEYVPIDTEGIWYLTVTASDNTGNTPVEIGNKLYINTSTAAVSKDSNGNTAKFFGYALGAVATGESCVVAVKVHADPIEVDRVLVGNSNAYKTSAVADTKFLHYRFSNSATSGDNRGMYLRLYLIGAGGGGEALRAFTTIQDVAAGSAHGAHISLNFGDTGTVTGQGVGVRSTLHCPDAVLANGSYYGGMSEIWFDGDTSDISGTTDHAIHCFTQGGDATGKATATNVLQFAGLSSTQFDDVGTATCAATLKCEINGNTRYLMFADSAAA